MAGIGLQEYQKRTETCMQDMVTVNGNPMAMGDCDGNRVGVLVIRANQCIRDREYLSLLHRIEFFSSIFKFLAEFREKFKQL